MANFQNIIRLLRDRKLSKKVFCESVGISYTGLTDILDRNSTRTDLLEKIADFFDVPVGYFFDELQADGTLPRKPRFVIDDPKESKIEKLETEVKHLNDLLVEKERLIQVLMNKKG